MTKNLMKGMAALCFCAAFTSCSHDAGFETPNQFELKKNEYNANFVKRYGPVDPNKNWDMTGYANSTRAITRADIGDYVKDSQVQEGYNFFSAIVNEEINVIKGLVSSNSAEATYKGNSISGTASIINWNHFFSVKLTPMYAHTNLPSGTYRYYNLGYSINGGNPADMIANIRVVGYGYDYWYDAKGSVIHHTSREVNTLNASGTSDYWCNYACDGRNQNPFYGTTQLSTDGFSASTITQVREILISVNGQHVRTYWGFDCDGDGDYSDVICLVRDLRYPDPEPIVKRYLIEDLGDSDDFDFNDIVVDCEDDGKGNKTATIRAMGGTYDFTLNIGGATWNKKNDGPKLQEPVSVTDMVNTKAGEINYNKVLGTFSIPNWNPADNNISVTVQESTYNTIYEIQFPHVGGIPMIVAVSPEVLWMTERTNVPEDWWKESSTSNEGE